MTEKIVIGNATLYHGDCREVLPMLEKIDVVITDPPYGMAFQSNYRSVKHLAIENDQSDELLQFACRIKASHSSYVFCRWDNIGDVPKPKSCITWVKNNWSMGDLSHEHARQTEIALFYPGDNHVWPKNRPTDVLMANRTGNTDHPTEKPVYLMEQMLEWTDGIVCDPFMGSGTTGVACINLRRAFIGIEIERKYFDIACERIERAYAQGKLFDGPGDAYDQVTRDYQQLEME